MKQQFITVLLVSTFLLTGCASVVATSGSIVIRDENSGAGNSFTDSDRQKIHQYYKSNRGRHKKYESPSGHTRRDGNLPYGLAKRDRLPPGLRTRGLPGDLELQLSTLANNNTRVIVGDNVVIVDSNSRVVIDIYRNMIVD
ncbi:MAG: hypothetical protein ACC641_05255 [Acidiferrobacterales bacterium]